MAATNEQHQGTTAFLLGAGFSRAVSREMPLMQELGTAIAQAFKADLRLRALLDPRELATIEVDRIPLGDVEVWLSALTTDQPFLTASENLQRRAIGADLAAVIADFVASRQEMAQRSEMPSWFSRLVAAWHFANSAVITLNYDTLVESAVHRLLLRSGEGGARAMAQDVLGDVPPLLPAGGRWGHQSVPSFRLYKLHGSANWFGRPEGNDIFSVVRDDDLVTRWSTDEDSQPARAGVARVRGLSPFIMPPTANKAELYANATMAGIWRAARREVAGARHMVIFGYSLPVSDTSMRSFLSQSITEDTRITVVDPSADRVAHALESLGLTSVASCEVGDRTYERLVQGVEREAPMMKRLHVAAQQPLPHFVAAETTSMMLWPVIRLVKSGKKVRLITDQAPIERGVFLTRPSSMTVDLRRIPSDAELIVRFPDGEAMAMDARVENAGSEGTNVLIAVGHDARHDHDG